MAERAKWRIRTDQELWELNKDLHIVLNAKKKRLGMDRTSSTDVSWKSRKRKYFRINWKGEKKGRPRLRWLENAENGIRKM